MLITEIYNEPKENYDCSTLPMPTNWLPTDGRMSPDGCFGALTYTGEPSKDYCIGDGIWNTVWWKKCCYWNAQKSQCLPKGVYYKLKF